LEPLKWHHVTEGNYRVGTIVQRQNQFATWPSYPVEFPNTGNEIITRREVIESGVRQNGVERSVGERKKAHVGARHQHLLGMAACLSRGNRREIYSHDEVRTVTKARAETAGSRFIEKVGL
jgi:hypothetical protein